MDEFHENLLKAIKHYQEFLDKYTENRNDGKLLHYLEKLYRLPIKVIHLEQTGVGRTVNGLRKLGGEVGDSAKSLVTKWKEMVVGEQEEEDEDDDEEDDDEEDGYQTGEEQSNDSDVKSEKEERIKDTSSSHKTKKHKHSSSKSEHDEDSAKSRREKKHHKHNGHSSKHKSYKRKTEDSSSDEEVSRKRVKKEVSSEDEERHKHRKKNDSDSEPESKSREKKHRSDEDRKKHKTKKSRESSSDVEDLKPNKIKEKHCSLKDKHKSSKKPVEKKHEHTKKTKEKRSESSKSKEPHKEKDKEKTDEKKHKTSKSKTALSNNGIDSGSGASFAEALGMCEPSSSKNSSKKKSTSNNSNSNTSSNNNNNNSINTSEKKEKTSTKTEDPIPKLLKEPLPREPIPIEPMDINISSLLPPITPNYRPLGNLINTEIQPKKSMTDYEALSNIITSKNQRTKVYSGNKTGNGKVPTLFELCIRILQDNIDALEYTGGVPYNVLKPILEKSTPNQLYALEHHNPYLIEDTDELWQLHCQKEFRNKKREEFESWREMYLRCLDERDAKLKALTANIKQAQDKSLPVRTTKLAYVDAVAKPPRNIARKQAKNGTAIPERKPTAAAKLSALATAGEAGKVAVPNPGVRAAERSGASHAVKPKKAPLMLKSISSFKNRFKR